jgi:hypothetical protein
MSDEASHICTSTAHTHTHTHTHTQAAAADKANQDLAAVVKSEVGALMKAKEEATKAEEM